MSSKVAILQFSKNETEVFRKAIQLIGGIDDLNSAKKAVIIKIGVFSHKTDNHTSVNVVKAIIDSFRDAPKIYLIESDNYRGKGLERLQIWKELFTSQVMPFNISDDTNTRRVRIGNQEMNLSHILFKPNIFVNTHILRNFQKGSILKNLFGCISDPKKAKYHKNEVFYPLLSDIYEVVGGIDLAVLDGTYLWREAGDIRLPMNTILVGRDAIAVETVGAILAGLTPEKMPVIQEFVQRGLGEKDLDKIEILGVSFECIKKKFASALKKLSKASLV